MQAFYSGHFNLPLPNGHRFPMDKYRRLHERVSAEFPAVVIAQAPAASRDELALAHHPEYVGAMESGSASAQLMREIGFPWSPALVERSRRSVGATIAAARAALAGDTISANMAGGTHHAGASQGSGFCVFNDVAVAARLMQAEWARAHRHDGPLRVAVVDLDVHQGNGTAQIFVNDPSVFTLSLHGAKNFPFRKAQSDLDVELSDGCGDAEYRDALRDAIATLQSRFAPQMLFYLAGADCHEGDRLGRLMLSFDGMMARDRMVFDWADRCHLPVAMVMAGGYGKDPSTTIQCQINTFTVALGHAQARTAAPGWQNQMLA